MMNANNRHYLSIGKKLAVILAFFMALPALAFPAKIILKNGKEITTSKYWEKKDFIEFNFNGLIARVSQKEIDRIENDPAETPPSPPPESQPASRENAAHPEKIPEVDKKADTGKKLSALPPRPEAEAAGKDTAYLTSIISAISKYKKLVGFRSLFWGCRVFDIYGLEKVGMEPVYGGIDKYVNPREKLKFGGANLEKIVYGFWRNKLISVTIWADGKSNYTALRKEVFNRFGKGIQHDSSVERRIWIGGSSNKYLEFDETTDKGLLWFRNRDLWDQIQNRSPAEPAADGPTAEAPKIPQ